MDAVEFLKERSRMYKSGAAAPALGLKDDYDPEGVVKIVEAWSAAHPRKTRQSVFLEQWPEAKRVDNILAVCPKVLNMSLPCWIYNNANVACEDCRREFWMQEVEGCNG